MDPSSEVHHGYVEQPPQVEHEEHEHLGTHSADGWRGRLIARFDRFFHPSKHRAHPDHEKRARNWDRDTPKHIVDRQAQTTVVGEDERTDRERLPNTPEDREARLDAVRTTLSTNVSEAEKLETIDTAYKQEGENNIRYIDDYREGGSDQEKRRLRIQRDRAILDEPISFEEKSQKIAERREKEALTEQKTDLMRRVGGQDTFVELEKRFNTIHDVYSNLDMDLDRDRLVTIFKSMIYVGNDEVRKTLAGETADFFLKREKPVIQDEDSPEVRLQEAIDEVADDIEENTQSSSERDRAGSLESRIESTADAIRDRNEAAEARRKAYLRRIDNELKKMRGDEEEDGDEAVDESEKKYPQRRMLGGWVGRTLEEQVRRKGRMNDESDSDDDMDDESDAKEKRKYERRIPTSFQKRAA